MKRWLALAAFLALGAGAERPHPTITAHRAGAGAAPENTRAALLQALEDGADRIELDVQLSADGVAMVVHDHDLVRVAGMGALVSELTAEELAQVDVGSSFDPAFAGEGIPTLASLIAEVDGRVELVLDLKPAPGGEPSGLIDAVLGLAPETALIICRDAGILQEIRRRQPFRRLGQIVTGSFWIPTDVEVAVLQRRLASQANIDRLHRSGLEVSVYTVNDQLAISSFIHLGVDDVITDEVSIALVARETALGIEDPYQSCSCTAW